MISLLLETFGLKLFAAADVAMLSHLLLALAGVD